VRRFTPGPRVSQRRAKRFLFLAPIKVGNKTAGDEVRTILLSLLGRVVIVGVEFLRSVGHDGSAGFDSRLRRAQQVRFDVWVMQCFSLVHRFTGLLPYDRCAIAFPRVAAVEGTMGYLMHVQDLLVRIALSFTP
jgi:hypothetical protein